MRRFVRTAAAIGILSACSPAIVSAADDVSFARDVWPIFRQHCWSCHAGDKPEGGLRLDVEEHLRRGGDSGPAFVPGKPDASALIEQVSGPRPAMPPKQPPLAAEQVESLRRWIVAGAKIDSMPVDRSLQTVIPAEYQFAPAITSVAVHPDGKTAACACRSEAVIVALDGTGPSRRLPTECDLVTHVEFSPDGRLLAAAGGTPALFGEVTFFEAATGKLVGRRRLSNDTLFRGSFSPDGRHLALGGADGAIYVVPVDPQADVKRLELHSDWVVDVCWTPDGTKLVTAGRDKTTKVADAKTGALLRTLDTLAERVNAVVADDKIAVSAGLTRAVSGYELAVALQNVEVTGSGNGAKPVSRVAQYLRAFPAQPGEVLDLALSRDLRLVAVVGLFDEARIYTPTDRKPAGTVKLAGVTNYAAALNRDGTQLVVGGKSGRLDVYELPDGKLLRSIEPVPVKKVVAAATQQK